MQKRAFTTTIAAGPGTRSRCAKQLGTKACGVMTVLLLSLGAGAQTGASENQFVIATRGSSTVRT